MDEQTQAAERLTDGIRDLVEDAIDRLTDGEAVITPGNQSYNDAYTTDAAELGYLGCGNNTFAVVLADGRRVLVTVEELR
jgi:hypothetical protein